jgi:hypothetical protein
VDGRLRGGIGVDVKKRDVETVDGTGVDHPGGVTGRGCGLELRHEGTGEVEDRLYVEGEHLVPGRVRKLFEGGAPIRAGIVDQDVKGLLARGDLGGEALCTFLGGQISRNRDAGS